MFSETLRGELAGTGVRVLTIYPGPVTTAMAAPRRPSRASSTQSPQIRPPSSSGVRPTRGLGPQPRIARGGRHSNLEPAARVRRRGIGRPRIAAQDDPGHGFGRTGEDQTGPGALNGLYLGRACPAGREALRPRGRFGRRGRRTGGRKRRHQRRQSRLAEHGPFHRVDPPARSIRPDSAPGRPLSPPFPWTPCLLRFSSPSTESPSACSAVPRTRRIPPTLRLRARSANRRRRRGGGWSMAAAGSA